MESLTLTQFDNMVARIDTSVFIVNPNVCLRDIIIEVYNIVTDSGVEHIYITNLQERILFFEKYAEVTEISIKLTKEYLEEWSRGGNK